MRTIYLAAWSAMLIVGCICTDRSYAQTEEQTTPFFSLTGSMMVTSDLYSSSASPDSAQSGRRPTVLNRLIFTPTLNFGDLISLPFNIILSNPETNTNTPATLTPTLAQFFENPANSLGFSSFSPRFGWAQFHLGSFSPQYSALTAGDQQIFGGGFDLTPGKFQFAASVGVAQRAIEPDTTKSIAGKYRRDTYMARLAYGKPDSGHFGLNFAYAKDAVGSLQNNIVSITPAHPAPDDPVVTIPTDTTHVQAQEGFVTSADFGISITDGVSLKAEGAASVFTRDESADEKTISGNPIGSLFITRTSTQADFAGNAALAIHQKIWGLTLSGLYMGAGFVPLGYAYMQSDRLEWTIAPEVRLFSSSLNLRGSVGERVNNLSKTMTETTTQLIGSAYVSADISDAFNISANFSNFGVTNDQSSDTLKVRNVSESFSVDPTLTLRDAGVSHSIMASIGLDNYTDYNTISGAQNSNHTRTALVGYNVALDSIPLLLGTTASYIENQLPTGTLIIRSIGVTAGYAFFERKLRPSLSLTESGSTDGTGATDAQLFFRLALRWDITKKITLSVIVGNNRYSYGNPTMQGNAYQERLLQMALTTRF